MKMHNLHAGVWRTLVTAALLQLPVGAAAQLNPLLGGAQTETETQRAVQNDPAPASVADVSTPSVSASQKPVQSADEMLHAFEPDAHEEYRLGRGDELQIDFLGRPELQLKTTIGPDGRVTLPVAGELVLDNLTRAEASCSVEKLMSQFYTSLSAQVTVLRYTSNRVLILGAVEHPGAISFDNIPTLLELLTRGGLISGVDAAGKLHPMPSQCAIYRGQNQVAWVQLKDLLSTGGGMANIRLRRDDVVYVPSSAERFVSVLGAVAHPGPITVGNGMPLMSILAEAGGLTDKAGQNPKIYVADPDTGKTFELPFRDLLDPVKTRLYALHPGQIVYVPQSRFARATYFFERLSPAFAMASYVDWMAVNN